MKKLAYLVAALGAIVIAAPSIASAQTVVIKRGGYHQGHHQAMARVPNTGMTAATIADGGMVIATRSWSSRSIATEGRYPGGLL